MVMESTRHPPSDAKDKKYWVKGLLLFTCFGQMLTFGETDLA